MISFITKKFNELSIHELYQLLQLRSEVFVVEQDCVYQDIDGKDEKALHVLGLKEGKIIAYVRLFNAGDYAKEAAIGRVVVQQKQRKYGYGREVMNFAILALEEAFNTTTIEISAQVYLDKFYTSLGFVAEGESYLEDGIPHIKMLRIG